MVAGFDGGRITSDAGVLLLREIARGMKRFERLAGCLPDPRDAAMIEHDQSTMFAQRILGIACGWEDLNDHDSLRIDPLMQVATERRVDVDRPLASASTLCRLENRFDPRRQHGDRQVDGRAVHRVVRQAADGIDFGF